MGSGGFQLEVGGCGSLAGGVRFSLRFRRGRSGRGWRFLSGFWGDGVWLIALGTGAAEGTGGRGPEATPVTPPGADLDTGGAGAGVGADRTHPVPGQGRGEGIG